MTFGARLAEVRKAKHLTQDGLGKGLGTDGKDAGKAVVYGWEKDQHFPRVDQLMLICKNLEVSSDYLLFGTQSDSALPPEVAEIADAITQLPPRQKDFVIRSVRDLIDLARESLTPGAPADEQPKQSSQPKRHSG